MKTPVERSDFGRRPAALRSRVSNDPTGGTLPGIDRRSAMARRFRDISAAVVADQGGVEHCAEARVQLIRRFAACACLAEQLEARLARGEAIDVAEHSTLASTMVRIAARIGLNRRAKNVTPTLQEYIEMRSQQNAAEDAE